MDDSDLTVPARLQTVLGEAAEQKREAITDHEWPDDDQRAARRDSLMAAATMMDHWRAERSSREEMARLAHRAISDQQPGSFIDQWPTTPKALDEFIARATTTRDLILYCDDLDGRRRYAAVRRA